MYSNIYENLITYFNYLEFLKNEYHLNSLQCYSDIFAKKNILIHTLFPQSF